LLVLWNKCKALNYYSNKDLYVENSILIHKRRKGEPSKAAGSKSRKLNIKSLLYNEQKGKCEYCNQILDNMEDELGYSLVVHHVIPKSKNGVDELKNLSLLHNNCHRILHKAVGRSNFFKLPYRYKNVEGKKK
jgi:5-methylcytosine-specific restriction endonuclease McrA